MSMRNAGPTVFLLGFLAFSPRLADAQRVRVIDRANLDTTCAACDDFYTFAKPYYGQADTPGASYEGGWYYDNNQQASDGSTAQWPALLMASAQANMGTIVPAFLYCAVMPVGNVWTFQPAFVRVS